MKAEIKERIEMISRGEVPEGYKKTKVGIIPEDWEVKRLKKYANIIDGDRGKNYPNDKDIVNSGVLFLSTKNIINSKFDFNEKRFITKEKFAELRKGKLQSHDVVITMRGSIGNVALFQGIEYESAFINAQMAIIRPYNINSEFLWLIMHSSSVQKRINVMSSGSAQPQLTKKVIEQLHIPKPSCLEQQKIAQILSKWDKAIKLKEQLIEKKKEQKKGLIQRLLTGEVRMPGFYGEWKEVRLGEITNRISEKNKGRSNNVLTISAEHGLINQEEYFTKQVASSNLDNYIYLVKGDFAYNKSYSRGYPMGVIKMLEKYEEGVVSSLYICFRTKQNVIRNYLKQYFYGGMFNYEIFKIAQEGSRNHGLLNIAIKDFFNIRLNLPPLQEQKAIAQVLSTADKEIELLEEELEQLKLQKKGLMQLLLTGIIRVKS